MEGKHWTGTRVFFWGSDSQIRYGTVLGSSRMMDVCPCPILCIYNRSNVWRRFGRRVRKFSALSLTKDLKFPSRELRICVIVTAHDAS